MRAKRHPLNYYATMMGSTAFFVVLSVFMLLIYRSERASGKRPGKERLLPLVSVMTVVVGAYGLKQFLGSAPDVSIDGEFLSSGGMVYSNKDIAFVRLTGKQPFEYWSFHNMESTTIRFRNDTQLILFDDFYSNAPALKRAISRWSNGIQTEPDEAEHAAISKPPSSLIIETFCGNPWTSLNGLTIVVVCGTMGGIQLFYPAVRNAHDGLLPVSLFCVFTFLFKAWQMHYFRIEDGLLVIRNHLFIWQSARITLAEIAEVVLQTNGKQSNSAVIIMRSFAKRSFKAGSLRNRHWRAMADALKQSGVKVRNEIAGV